MAEHNSPELDENESLSFPWAECVPRNGMSAGEVSLSYGRCTASRQIQIYEEDTLDAVAEILGYPEYNTTTGNLDRTLPWAHPIHQTLYASGISYRGLGFDEKSELVSGQGYIEAYASYNINVLTIIYTTPTYTIISDATLDATFGSPRQEYRRYVSYRIEPAIDNLSREGKSFIWAEGPSVGKPLPGSLNQPLQKCELLLTWHGLPTIGFLSPSGLSIPAGILKALGQINLNQFLDYPAGTLLVKGLRLIPREAPIVEDWVVSSGVPGVVFDLEISLGQFNPKSGGPTRGWNLQPYPGTGSFAGLWWRVSTDPSDPGGAGLFGAVDYPSTLFSLSTF